jgi:LacI family transcriptional regulator
LLREQSFRQAVGNFGLSAPDAWIVREADFFEQSGYRAMSGLNAAGTLPRAIFAASDQLAIGAMRALKEAGLRVPQHVALIGCDDIESCKYMDPPLSTIRQNKDKIGTLAAHMLFDLMNRELTPGLVMVEPELVVRET